MLRFPPPAPHAFELSAAHAALGPGRLWIGQRPLRETIGKW